MDRGSSPKEDKQQLAKDIPGINSSEIEADLIQITPVITDEPFKSQGSESIPAPYSVEHENEGISILSLEENYWSSDSNRAQNDQNELTESIDSDASSDSINSNKAPEFATLELAVQNFKENKIFIELEKKFIHEDIDFSNLNKTLKRNDGCGLVLSILLILDIKDKTFCFDNLETFLLCFDNIKFFLHKEIVNREISRLINKLKYFIFDFEKSFDEKKSCIRILEAFCSRNSDHIDGYKAKDEFIDALYLLNQSIINSCREANNLKTVENEITLEIKRLAKCKLFKNIELRNLYFESLKLHCKTFDCLSDDLKNFIESMKAPISLPISYKFAEMIESNLLQYFSKYLDKSIDLSVIEELCESLIESYKEKLEECHVIFLNTAVNNFPDIDAALCWALSNLLKLPLQDFLVELYISETRFFRENCMITSFVNNLSAFPLEMQYIFVEMLSRIDINDYSHLQFLVKKINPMFKFKRIKKKWAKDFVTIACKPPFSDILQLFSQSTMNLKQQLDLFTKNIILMKMPFQLYGFTLYNLNIVLHRFKKPAGKKGATFVVYLHELAHILQRLPSSTYNESMQSKSQINFNVSEGGFYLEELIFGSRLLHITDKAARFLLSNKVPTDIKKFQSIFKKINEIVKNEKFTSLSRSNNATAVGGCLGFSRKN